MLDLIIVLQVVHLHDILPVVSEDVVRKSLVLETVTVGLSKVLDHLESDRQLKPTTLMQIQEVTNVCFGHQI